MGNIGPRIRKKGTEKGLYQEHLADAIHVDRSVISKKEKDISQYKLLKSGIDPKTLDSLKRTRTSTQLLSKSCAISLTVRLMIFLNSYPKKRNRASIKVMEALFVYILSRKR